MVVRECDAENRGYRGNVVQIMIRAMAKSWKQMSEEHR